MRQSKNQRGLSLLLAVIIIFSGVLIPMPSIAKAASASSKIKVSDFIRIIVQATELEINDSKGSPYLKAAIAAGIVKTGDFKDYKAYLTRTDTAVILNRADEYLYGDTVDSKLLKTVLEGRISDINKITKSKRDAVAKVYAKGFMKGYSKGYYIKTREFRGNEYMTVAGARGAVAMLKDVEKRAKISPDGQIIRSTDLPKNAKDYEYILETYPNSFYEMKFMYQRAKFYFEPEELVDYAEPKNFRYIDNDMKEVLDNYQDIWIKRIIDNLESRLNISYKSVDTNWINKLRSTYTIYGERDVILDKRIIDDIKKYVKFVKKNDIVIQSSIVSVEPSTLYMFGAGYYVRTYVKFKLNYSGSNYSADDLLYGNKIWMPDLEKNTWYEGIYDIKLGTVNGSSDGRDYYVIDDSLQVYTD